MKPSVDGTPANVRDMVALSMNPSIDLSTSVERVEPIHKLRCTAVNRDPGGGGVNVARVVRRFGSDVTAIYPAGGATGRRLRRLVEREGIESLAIETLEETREDFNIFEKETGNQFRFVLPGPPLAQQEWRACIDAVSSFTGRTKFLVASGSLPPGVPEDFYGRIARMAKDMDARLVIDASGPPLEAALNEGVYLFKPSLHELQELLRAPLEDQEAWIDASVSLVHAGRAEIVALTLGERGALLATRDHVLRGQPLPINPVSTAGAGDSFLGGIVWSIASGHGLDDAFRYGNAAGGGARSGHRALPTGRRGAPLSRGGLGDRLGEAPNSRMKLSCLGSLRSAPTAESPLCQRC